MYLVGARENKPRCCSGARHCQGSSCISGLRPPAVTRCSSATVLTSEVAWQRLRDMEVVLARQPAVARAVRCLPLLDQLELTLELLSQSEWPQFDNCEELPPNVVRFRPRMR
jgi:hypothetical protein